jgi:DNA polymerase elongation subunit (family B)
MSYISAKINKKSERIEVVERINDKRIYNSYPIDYSFYVDDPNGQYKTIYNTPVTKITPRSSSEFHKELARLGNKKVWESDLNLVYKCLSQNYRHKNAPELHITLFDIEVDFDSVRGYAPIDDPFAAITAVTMQHQWNKELITLALKPKTYTIEKANEIAAKFENTIIFENEVDMLSAILDLLEDTDIISGWNSSGFDIPYLINRITRIMSKDDTSRLCLWNEKPKEKTVEKYGKEISTYELVGRVHLDLMEVYIKFTYEERHSYSLNAIAEHELGQSKTPYTGSLDKLYNEDFEKFIEYNRQDVILLSLLEDKLKFIDLLNGMAHDTTTLLSTCMGTVAVIDQAIVNRIHDRGQIAPNRKNNSYEGNESVAGAYVATPKSGAHEWVGVIDINSLYPSTIRALNMGLETIVGQIRPTLTDDYISEQFKKQNMTFAHAWENQFGSHEYQAVMARKQGIDLIIDWEETGKNDTVTADQCYDLIFNSGQPWMLSGNGTIFTYAHNAIIPGLLLDWYTDRKEFQKKQREATDLKIESFFNRRQHIEKIKLNSLYGALLSPASRFFDKRLGQSVTLSGRIICKHINSFANECITGEYNIEGAAICAADTDSTQFSAWTTIKPMVDRKELEWNKEAAVQLYTAIGEKVNESFPTLMEKMFNCPQEFGSLIKASCESVGYRGLYITKKRYAILNYWKDGKYLKEPKLKAMGLDLRRSDTPVVCQKFLKTILMEFLTTGSEQNIIKMINDFKIKFKALPPSDRGTPKRVNNLTNYMDLIQKGKGNRVPGHVRAAINWNILREINNDKIHTKIVDGMKCVVCPLKNNINQMTSIAYPTDEISLPNWFTVLPFDEESMIKSVVEKKIENLFGKLPNWKTIENATKKINTYEDFFE